MTMRSIIHFSIGLGMKQHRFSVRCIFSRNIESCCRRIGIQQQRYRSTTGSTIRSYAPTPIHLHRLPQFQNWKHTTRMIESSKVMNAFYFSTSAPPMTVTNVSVVAPIDTTTTTTAGSTTTTTPNNVDVVTLEKTVRPIEDDEIILYVRDEEHPDAIQNTIFMKAGFAFSSFHTLYWVWYTFDFIPHVNKAAMEVLHVDPMIGVAGIVFALALQSGFVIYPLRLISKLVYRMDEKRICIYTHSFPRMFPSQRLNTSFPLGTPNTIHNTVTVQKQQLMKATSKEDIKKLNETTKAAAKEAAKLNVQYFTLDATTPTAVNLIQGECQGDISKFRGHLVLGPRWPKYILDIKASHEVKEPALLLQALLKPEHFYYRGGGRNYDNQNNTKDNHTNSNSRRQTSRPGGSDESPSSTSLRKKSSRRSPSPKPKRRR